MMGDPKRARNRKRGNKPRVDLHITAPVFYSTRKMYIVYIIVDIIIRDFILRARKISWIAGRRFYASRGDKGI
jgi:hypothetical protein